RRHMALEPGTTAGFPGLDDANPGHGEDIAGEGKPEAGMVPDTVLEDPLFFPVSNSDTVILKEKDKFPVIPLAAGYPDPGDMRTVTKRVLKQVVDDLDR